MAASAIDEAVRNCVAVGADPARIAILDNFCWGYTDRPETLGSLVRASLACHDVAITLGTPFISGKDSLNNEFSYLDERGAKQTIAIPPSLLISALGQVPDVRTCVTMDVKEPGNRLYQIGVTRNELGGSHFAKIHRFRGGSVPRVHATAARTIFAAIHRAIRANMVRSCHDLSEGGLAVALSEMAFAGGWGAQVDVTLAPAELDGLDEVARIAALMFAESNTRFVCEVAAEQQPAFESLLREDNVPCAVIGTVLETDQLVLTASGDETEPRTLVEIPLADLKEAWQAPLRW
jgi:phosphoribosylformylglycinamidine synthase